MRANYDVFIPQENPESEIKKANITCLVYSHDGKGMSITFSLSLSLPPPLPPPPSYPPLRHVNTMLLLASFPPYPPASHEPSVWFDQLMSIANVSRKLLHGLVWSHVTVVSLSHGTFLTAYQKILNWTPLFELLAIRLVGVVGGGARERTVIAGDRVEVEIALKYYGPKVMVLMGVAMGGAWNDSASGCGRGLGVIVVVARG